MQLWKLGCRWGKGSGKPLFYDFIKSNNVVIGWVKKDYQIGDWILITNGHTVLSLAEIISKRKSVLDFPEWEAQLKNLEIPFENDIFIYDAKFLNLSDPDRFIYPLQQGIVKVKGEEYIQTFNKLRTKYMAQEKLSSHLNLLQYKKQIILQGPPGTGKTKLAKQLAREISLLNTSGEVTISDIIKSLKEDLAISTPTGYNTFKIVKHNSDSVTVYPKDAKNPYNVPYREIMKSAKLYKQPEQETVSDFGGMKSYIIALANYIVEAGVNSQIRLIQFHPSFSYEDFVRGIVAESQGDKIEYKNVNKILGQFAREANDNYELSKKDNLSIQQEKWIEESFNDFKEEIETAIEEKEFNLSNNIGIFKVESDCFKYGKDWSTASRINFSEFKKLIEFILNGDLDPTQNSISKQLSVHAHFRQTYYLALLRVFLKDHKFNKTEDKEALKNYVLIIDEINRANLSSVLGELIYALEYRGEKVESMYAIGGNSELVLPPNLFIIGTMNTADRSVGHIDYAIRRRFAFVEILPKDLTNEPGVKFHSGLFNQVAELFRTNVSPEFEINDVQLGHSYFIDKTEEGGTMPIRLKYEITPILMEYVKDGILIGDGILQKIAELSV